MSTPDRPTTRETEPLEADRLGTPFGRWVHDALAHLYDPLYLQTHPLARRLQQSGHLPGPNLGHALRVGILDAIASLQPAGGAGDPELLRGHRILTLRYAEALGIAEVQAQLAISRRQYFRAHQRALAAVVSLLQLRWGWVSELAVSESPTPGPNVPTPSAPSQAGAFAPQASLRVADLPTILTSFVGREREIAEIEALLRTTRLLTLTGSGGCGKTRLALRVASGLAGEYPDGVRLVELASLADPRLVPQTVAVALGIGEERGRSLTETLVNCLRPQKALLLVDNCEHLLQACAALLEALLRGCPQLQVIVTSREALGIGGETRWRVPSLSAPPPKDWSDRREIGRYESVQLFVERARAVKSDFTVTADNAPAVAEVCWRLDGIPLAVELAAARVRVLAVEQIAQRLDDRFRLLTDGSRTALPRHQTLRATIDWSHDLLGPAARAVFRRLAVFAGGWTLAAAEAVSAEWPAEAAPDVEAVARVDVLDLLTQLVDRSLVWVEEAKGEARYRFLETIREYATDNLKWAGEVAEARRRHYEWCLSLGWQALPELIGPQQGAWFERLEREHDNLRAALAWCQAQPDGAAEVELAAPLGRFWRFCYVSEGRRWLGHAVSRGSVGSPRSRAHVLNWAGVLEYIYGDWVTAKDLLEHAIALFRELADGSGTCMALRHMSLIVHGEADLLAARRALTEALASAQEAGDDREICWALWMLGFTVYEMGEREEGRRLIEESLAQARVQGDSAAIVYALGHLNAMALQEGVQSLDHELLEERLAQARASNWKMLAADSLGALADAARVEGDLVTASAYLRESAIRVRETGEIVYVVSWLERCAALAATAGNAAGAARLFGAAEAICEGMGATGTAGTRLFLPRARYDQERTSARLNLGEEAFAAEFARGQALSLDESVAYALAMT